MLYIILVFLPLISFLIVFCAGRFIGRHGACFLTTFFLFLAFSISLVAFLDISLRHTIYNIKFSTWFNLGLFSVEWGFLFDALTSVMLIVVTSISFFVHLYSIEYMKEDPHLPRFMAYLSLFTFFMLLLITADNMIQMFFGWEGVGLASYLLINFWYSRMQANKSAIKAIIVNRVGDFGLSLAIFVIFYSFKSFEFSTIFALAPRFSDFSISFVSYDLNVLELISFLLFVGAVGKSAQLGLHTWLPDAMEGPTPVSALIHAATMVTAGVFVIIRFSPLIEFTSVVPFVMLLVGGLTAFFSATVGMFQNDLKRVIAYSTCSQLGYMVFACGLSAYSASAFHLTNHAFFKALLFLGAGRVIHAMRDEQDMRRMGGLAKLLPFTYSAMLIGSLSLMGFPFLTGFYSKDFILELASARYTVSGEFVYWLATVSALFTSFYSFRLLYFSFISVNNSSKILFKSVHEAPIYMALPLLLLSFGSIFIGYLFRDAFIGLGTDFWNGRVFVHPSKQLSLESEFLPFYLKLIPVIFSLIGVFLSYLLYSKFKYYLSSFIYSYFLPAFSFFSKRWYFDVIYNNFIVLSTLSFGYKVSFKLIDRGLLEYIGPYGIVFAFKRLFKGLLNNQSGLVFNYVFTFLIGFFVIFVLYISSFYIVLPLDFYVLIMFLIFSSLFSGTSHR